MAAHDSIGVSSGVGTASPDGSDGDRRRDRSRLDRAESINRNLMMWRAVLATLWSLSVMAAIIRFSDELIDLAYFVFRSHEPPGHVTGVTLVELAIPTASLLFAIVGAVFVDAGRRHRDDNRAQVHRSSFH